MNKKIIAVIVIIAMIIITVVIINQYKPVVDNDAVTQADDATSDISTDTNTDTDMDVDDAPAFTEEIKITDDTFQSEVIDYEGIVIVDFWAAWCGPCIQLAPILEEVMLETGVKLAKLDVDENPIKSREYNIKAIPSVYIFYKGEVVENVIGLNQKQRYIDVIEGIKK